MVEHGGRELSNITRKKRTRGFAAGLLNSKYHAFPDGDFWQGIDDKNIPRCEA